MKTFLPFKRDTNNRNHHSPYSGIVTFCEKFCFEPLKNVMHYLDLAINIHR